MIHYGAQLRKSVEHFYIALVQYNKQFIMSSKYRPTEYHAGLKWDQERAGKVIITPGTPYPPTEYHAREKMEKSFQKKHNEGKRKGWW